MIKCLFLLIVLQQVGLFLVECQGCNNNISRDKFYYNNYNGYIVIIERYYAWISLKDRDRDRGKDKDKDKHCKRCNSCKANRNDRNDRNDREEDEPWVMPRLQDNNYDDDDEVVKLDKTGGFESDDSVTGSYEEYFEL